MMVFPLQYFYMQLPDSHTIHRWKELFNPKKNDILFVNIFSYSVKLLNFKHCPCFVTCRENKNSYKLITFSSQNLFSIVICQSPQFCLTFLTVYCNTLECFPFFCKKLHLFYLFIWHCQDHHK